MTELEKSRSALNWEERFTASSKPMQTQTNTAGSENPKEGFASGGGLLRCGAPGHRAPQNKNLALNLKSWLSKTVWRKNYKGLPMLERRCPGLSKPLSQRLQQVQHQSQGHLTACPLLTHVPMTSVSSGCRRWKSQVKAVVWCGHGYSAANRPYPAGKERVSKTSSTVLLEWSSIIPV